MSGCRAWSLLMSQRGSLPPRRELSMGRAPGSRGPKVELYPQGDDDSDDDDIDLWGGHTPH